MMPSGLVRPRAPRWRAGRAGVPCAVLGVLLIGCDGGTGPVGVNCPDIATPGVVVTVLDASTGEADATGARGIVRDGAYSDSLRRSSMLASGRLVSLEAAIGRPGTYTVRVERPGYHAAERTGVVAAAAPCGVVTAEVTLWLQPAP